MNRGTALLARWRVTVGFAFGLLAFLLAQPTSMSLAIGGGIAALGELVRLWAAGHLEKSREVTRSGPYRLTRHPLYVGSSVIGVGVAIACWSVAVAALVALYLFTTIPAAIVAEESHLRDKFGGAYDAYARSEASPMPRTFSWSRARGNREHHTIAGVLLGFALLALKVQLSIR